MMINFIVERWQSAIKTANDCFLLGRHRCVDAGETSAGEVYLAVQDMGTTDILAAVLAALCSFLPVRKAKTPRLCAIW